MVLQKSRVLARSINLLAFESPRACMTSPWNAVGLVYVTLGAAKIVVKFRSYTRNNDLNRKSLSKLNNS